MVCKKSRRGKYAIPSGFLYRNTIILTPLRGFKVQGLIAFETPKGSNDYRLRDSANSTPQG